ncbi:MAG: alpha/beta hydrolase-fold protein [Bacteroidales bacterium]
MTKITFNSSLVGTQTVEVWLPPEYGGGNHFPILYLFDGQDLFPHCIDKYKRSWNLDSTLCTLIGSAEIDACIVVALHCDVKHRFEEYFPEKFLMNDTQESRLKFLEQIDTPLFSDRYLRFITEELKQEIDKRFSTKTDSTFTYIGGSDLGALTSLYAVCEYPHVFGAAICMSPCLLGFKKEEDSPLYELLNAYLDEYLPQPGAHRFYIDFGMEGKDGRSLMEFNGILQTFLALGYGPYSFGLVKLEDGDSKVESWRERIGDALVFMLGHERMGK